MVCSTCASGSGRRGRLTSTARYLGVSAIVSSLVFAKSNACLYEPSPKYVGDGGEEEVPQHPHQVLPTWDPSNAGPSPPSFATRCLWPGAAPTRPLSKTRRSRYVTSLKTRVICAYFCISLARLPPYLPIRYSIFCDNFTLPARISALIDALNSTLSENQPPICMKDAQRDAGTFDSRRTCTASSSAYAMSSRSTWSFSKRLL
jgi:hypothetical protein